MDPRTTLCWQLAQSNFEAKRSKVKVTEGRKWRDAYRVGNRDHFFILIQYKFIDTSTSSDLIMALNIVNESGVFNFLF